MSQGCGDGLCHFSHGQFHYHSNITNSVEAWLSLHSLDVQKHPSAPLLMPQSCLLLDPKGRQVEELQ